jgi:hypothetical protein
VRKLAISGLVAIAVVVIGGAIPVIAATTSGQTSLSREALTHEVLSHAVSA